MKESDLQIGKKYRINYVVEDSPSECWAGIGILSQINPPEYVKGTYEFTLPGDSVGTGFFTIEDIVQEMVDEGDFFNTFDQALGIFPFLKLNIGYSRVTDWTIHIYDSAASKALEDIKVSHYSRTDAMQIVTTILRNEIN